MALLGHSLAAYISVLERERLRKLTTRILSDTTLWLCRLFRYAQVFSVISCHVVSVLPVIQTLLSDLKLFIEMPVRALIIGSTFGSPQQILLAVSSLEKLRWQNIKLFIRTMTDLMLNKSGQGESLSQSVFFSVHLLSHRWVIL